MPPLLQEDVAKMLNRKTGWAGMERALREQMVKEGHLPKSILWEYEGIAADPTTTIELETDEEFLRTFTDPQLGLALNLGHRGALVVKRCVPGSPAASRRIPPGCELVEVNQKELMHLSLKDAQLILKDAERPVTLKFRQTEASRAIAQGSLKAAEDERTAAQRAKEEAKVKYEEEMRPTTPETAATFSRTYTQPRLGLVLHESEDKKRTSIKSCIPRMPAYKSGIPSGAVIVAINGKSVQFRRFKEVKKLVEIAQRPITIDFSMEDEPVYPPTTKKVPGQDGVPAYAFRPI